VAAAAPRRAGLAAVAAVVVSALEVTVEVTGLA
jgi:hypothetical protein